MKKTFSHIDPIPICDRLKALRIKLGFDRSTAFSKHLGMKNSTYAGYENGTKIPPSDFLFTLKNKFPNRVDLNWLLTGLTISEIVIANERNTISEDTIGFDSQDDSAAPSVGQSSGSDYFGRIKLLDLASKIFSSKNEYADWLAANIKLLYKNIINERRINELESQIQAMKIELNRRLNELNRHLEADRRKGERRQDHSSSDDID